MFELENVDYSKQTMKIIVNEYKTGKAHVLSLLTLGVSFNLYVLVQKNRNVTESMNILYIKKTHLRRLQSKPLENKPVFRTPTSP